MDTSTAETEARPIMTGFAIPTGRISIVMLATSLVSDEFLAT